MQGTKNQSSLVEQLKKKLKKAEKDNLELSQSISELNECYSQKIQMLEDTIEGYQTRIEELLNWKKDYIDHQLFDNKKYEEENKKLLGIIDQLYDTFENEKNKLRDELRQKENQIEELREQKQNLVYKTIENDQKVEQLVREHIREIEQLKSQLVQLKAEIGETESEYYQQKCSSKIMDESMGQIKQEGNNIIDESMSMASQMREEQQKQQIQGQHNQLEDDNTLKQIKMNNYSMNSNDGSEETRVKIAQPPNSNIAAPNSNIAAPLCEN